MPLTFQNALDTGLNFFYPPICQICRQERATAAEGYVCSHCRVGVRHITAPFCQHCGLPFHGDITTTFECTNCQGLELHFRSARSVVQANALLLDIIHRYKYDRQVWFEPFLAGLLTAAAAPEIAREKWDFIVPVPLFSVRKREREFNQADVLAARLSEKVKIPVNKNLLRRVKATMTQTRLSREQRAANVAAAFAYVGEGRLAGQKIILLDDVFTTGATTNACARALQKAGAGDICVWTLARGGAW